jgi:putative membrane protein
MSFLVRILMTSFAIMLAEIMLPGVHVESYFTAIILSIVLSFLNVFVKPIFIFFTLPATLLTLGLFLLVINAFIILMADWMVDGFVVESFWWALLFSVILSILTSIFEAIDNTKP